MCFILGEGGVRPPLCVLILVAKAINIKNEHQSQKHACCLLINILEREGKEGEERRRMFAWFSDICLTC